MRLRAAHHTLAPPVPDDALQRFRAGAIVPIEGSGRHVVIELGAVSGDLHLKTVEHFLGEPARIRRRLHHQRRYRRNDSRLGDPAFAMPRQTMHHFPAAGGMADVNGVLQVEMCGQRRQIIRIMIHVMAVSHLSGPAMASAVVGYDAIAVLEEEQHLRVPVVGRERPAMAEYDRLTLTPIFVKDFGAVSGRDRTHGLPSFCCRFSDLRSSIATTDREGARRCRSPCFCLEAQAEPTNLARTFGRDTTGGY